MFLGTQRLRSISIFRFFFFAQISNCCLYSVSASVAIFFQANKKKKVMSTIDSEVSVSFLDNVAADVPFGAPATAPMNTIVVDALELGLDDDGQQHGNGEMQLPVIPTAAAAASPPPPPAPPSLADYLAQHNLVPVFDRMFQECAKRLHQQQQSNQAGTANSSNNNSNNPVCDGMIDVVSDMLFQRSALSTRPCVPPDAINHSPSAATVNHMRNVFGGKRVLVVLELPTTLLQLPQGPNDAEETGPAVLSWYRLEMMCRTIVAIASLASGSHTMAGKFTPRVVVGIVMTPSQQEEEEAEEASRAATSGSNNNNGKAKKKSSLKKKSCGWDCDDTVSARGRRGGRGITCCNKWEQQQQWKSEKEIVVVKFRSIGCSCDAERIIAVSRRWGDDCDDMSDFDEIEGDSDSMPSHQTKHNVGGARRNTGMTAADVDSSTSTYSSVPAPPDSALYALAALLQGEGIDTEFLTSHTSLLVSNISAESAGAGAVSDNNNSDDEGGNNNPNGGLKPIQVRILPATWTPSESSSNPLSAFDPVLAFADVVVIEGLETMRLHHPLLTFVPKSIGSAMLGVGAALELCALRAVLSCGSSSRRRIEFPAPATTGGAAVNSRIKHHHSNNSNNTTNVPKQRILIIGDDEEFGGGSIRTLTSRSPLLLPSALEHLVAFPEALEAVVYEHDRIYLVGSAALVWQRVVNKRRRFAEEEGGIVASLLTDDVDNGGNGGNNKTSATAGRPPTQRLPRQEFSLLEWASRTEAAVCALLDAVDYFSPTVPGGCLVIPASDFVIVKKTTSGKSKVDVVTRQTFESTEYFQANGQACPPKFYYADVGPATRAEIVSAIQTKASFVAGFGSVTRCSHHVGGSPVTRCSHHVGGSRAATTAFSATLSEEVERKVLTSTTSQEILTACKGLGGESAVAGGGGGVAVPVVVFGEHWAQSLAHYTEVSLPIPAPQVTPSYYQPPALLQQPPTTMGQFLQNPAHSTSTAGGNGNTTPRGGRFSNNNSMNGVPSALIPQNLLSSSTTNRSMSPAAGSGHSPNIRSSSVVSESTSPAGARRRQSVARSPRSTIPNPSNHPRPRALSVCHLTSQRLVRKDKTVQEESAIVHLSTLPYRQVARVMAGDCWDSLRDLPCSVPTRTTVHRW
ncbi:transmembrane protein, putative [Bodo saltans]|uniref:Transmembrane protein, putative n=1 Tax=Bodo saltans TaxID=75058 RepID=A0A0S4JHL1_BODSA|nr:transmembrane protein, putative [Bodo saltans]|eukprot:CUG89426.1 transmembrane protein, putative [Bodo saltans]